MQTIALLFQCIVDNSQVLMQIYSANYAPEISAIFKELLKELT